MVKKSILINISLLSIAGVIIGAAFMVNENVKPARLLPIFGKLPKDSINPNTKDNYHSVYDFRMTDQTGQTVTLDSFKHKIFVVNFFFASCQGICKCMSNQLEKVTLHFKGNRFVKFVSYTANPEHDSVKVLAEYARLHNAIPYQWYFLTGNKKEIYNLACRSYLDVGDECLAGETVHTDNMALIDTGGHIRGFYKGTDSTSMVKLTYDIQLLLTEEKLASK